MSDFDPLDYGQHEGTEATADAKLGEAQEESDLKWLMADRRGCRVVRALLERSGVFRSSFTGDAQSTAFREGERNVGLGFLALVTCHAPERLAEIFTGKDGYEPRDHTD